MGRYRSELHEDLIPIAYYVSDYGYGHAARSIAVIRQLLADSPVPLRLIVNCGRALGFLRDSLQGYTQHRLEFRSTFSDTGYVLQADSIAADMEHLRMKYKRDMELFEERVDLEGQFLQQNRIQLIISDISPIPIAAAAKAGVESLGISNFTWYTAYHDMLEMNELCRLREAYARMDHFIGLAGCAEPAWGCKDRIGTGFFCRKPDSSEVKRIRRQIDPNGRDKIVFFALGMSIEVEDMASLPLWNSEGFQFIVSSNIEIQRDNITSIPAEYSESQNYLAAADLVITKPGWGTVSEAIQFKKPLLLLNRSQFYEDRHTIDAIPDNHPLLLLTWEEILQLDLNEIPELEQVQMQSIRSHWPYGSYERKISALDDITQYISNLLQHVKV